MTLIYVYVSNSCPYCKKQILTLKNSFFADEYEIINIDESSFIEQDVQILIENGVPCTVIRGDDLQIKYYFNGVVDGENLREIERSIKKSYLFID